MRGVRRRSRDVQLRGGTSPEIMSGSTLKSAYEQHTVCAPVRVLLADVNTKSTEGISAIDDVKSTGGEDGGFG